MITQSEFIIIIIAEKNYRFIMGSSTYLSASQYVIYKDSKVGGSIYEASKQLYLYSYAFLET